MEQKNHHSSHSSNDSFSGFEPWNSKGGFDVKKKRKLLFEQLSLPTPKLLRWDPKPPISSSYGDNFKFNKNPQKDEEEEEINFTKMAMEVKEISKVEVLMDSELQRSYGHEEDLLEFGSHGSGIADEECCEDSKHNFVLSSGRWNVDPASDVEVLSIRNQMMPQEREGTAKFREQRIMTKLKNELTKQMTFRKEQIIEALSVRNQIMP